MSRGVVWGLRWLCACHAAGELLPGDAAGELPGDAASPPQTFEGLTSTPPPRPRDAIRRDSEDSDDDALSADDAPQETGSPPADPRNGLLPTFEAYAV